MATSEKIAFSMTGEFITNLCRHLTLEGNIDKALKILDDGFDEISNEQATMICEGKMKIVSCGNGGMQLVGESPEYEHLLEIMNIQRIKPLEALEC